MNKNKTAVFIGHGDCPLSVEDIKPFIEQEILNGVDTFLNGGQGAFDRISAQAVHFLKKHYPKIKNILVIPYHNFRIFDETLFDEIIMPDNANSVSYKGYKTAIPKRNRFMIEKSSTAICYVNHISGGAYKTYQLAVKKKLEILNIYNELKKQKYERTETMQTKLISVTTDLLTLACLSQKPSYCCEISDFIEKHSPEGTAVSRNGVFTSLFSLCEKGYVKSETAIKNQGRNKEIYTILPEGKEYYNSFLDEYQKHISSVNTVLNSVSLFN